MKAIYLSLLGLSLSLISHSQVQTSPKENGYFQIFNPHGYDLKRI